jgi:Lon protease-like protein
MMFLALFPLQLALFPGEQVPLHIFEPRYKQLINECLEENLHFGIPAYLEGNIALFGTEVVVSEVLKTYDNGEMDIVVRGMRVFKIVEFQKDVPDKLYSGATVEYQEGSRSSTDEAEKELREKYSELMRLVKQPAKVFEDEKQPLSYGIGAEAGLSLQQRIHVLSLADELDRQQFLLEHINRAIRAVREHNTSPGRVSTNGHARFPAGPGRA